MKRGFGLVVFLMTGWVLSCSSPGDKADEEAYRREIDGWHARRVANLTKSDGWLSLAGRFWLEEGENRFGSGSDNPVRFPEGSAPARMGSFFLEKGVVRVRILLEVIVTAADSSRVQEMIMQDDAAGAPTMLCYGTLSWHVIRRGDRYAIRLRDSAHENLTNFQGIERYPVDPAWRLRAKFVPYEPVKKLRIVNVVGQVEEQPCPGALLFTIQGKEYRLDPLDEGPGEPFFVIIADETSGGETYGGGRFLYVERPDSAGETIIDFNKAYNPPCSFTPYATCPLPPDQNRLPIAVRAGEKRYRGEAAH
ncbi:MAG TPA: DUF1684 domain-containing protein [bacterium]|nr:DUF1684 domain-containing protein [bacterium]